MEDLTIVLVALYRYLNFPVRTMHPLLEKIDGVKPHSIFFKDCETNSFNYPTRKEEALFIDLIKKLNPRIVGFSVLSPYVPVASRLTRLIKEYNQSTLVIWGGAHVTISPESCIDQVDMLCVGEGEGAIGELAECVRNEKSYHAVNNLWVKNGDRVIKNPLRPLIQDLNSLPFPAYGKDSYYFINSNKVVKKDPAFLADTFLVQTSRGCPYSCSYCINSLLQSLFKGLGPYTRRRSVDNVIKEIRENNRADTIYFIDEVFGTDKSWLDEFETRYSKEVGLPFYVEYNPKVINTTIISKLVNAGLDMINFGIQSGSDFIRNQIFNRPGTNEEIIKLAQELAGYKVKVKYDLIIDNPYDTEESLKGTIELLLRLPKPLFFNLYSLQYFPHHPLTEKAIRDKYIRPEFTHVDVLMKRITQNWVFVPRLFPLTKKQILQNIIWLIVWNHAQDRTVRYALSRDTVGSRLCLAYLNFKAIILGKILGIGGFVWRNRWIAYCMRGFSYVLRGDFGSLYVKIKKKVNKRRSSALRQKTS